MINVPCSFPGCINLYRNHKWGAIKAYSIGWFIQKNGKSWCPRHVPDWAKEWRKKNA